ncbi:hypothetical protein JOB18_043039 [Solea senegalensis]|uniref:Uncharacterized protein n=1 Tax=Solea senegalensis TaxID=28829 RepID=A0AAV6SVG7_SOLSE|nr:hypothetical protein JOB18_043039 [Solea senegalensis]
MSEVNPNSRSPRGHLVRTQGHHKVTSSELKVTNSELKVTSSELKVTTRSPRPNWRSPGPNSRSPCPNSRSPRLNWRSRGGHLEVTWLCSLEFSNASNQCFRVKGTHLHSSAQRPLLTGTWYSCWSK